MSVNVNLVNLANLPKSPKSPAAIPLYLMAKAPLAGAVKTRMSPPLAPAQCAALARLMLAQTAAAANRHWAGAVVLCVSPTADHPAFGELAAQYGMAVVVQQGDDLGARMMSALQHGIARSGAAAVIGCDVPHLPAAILTRAHEMLANGNNPIGAAADGGFYLLGLCGGNARHDNNDAHQKLFDGIDWGTPPLAQVRARAAALDLAFCDLPTVRDIDHYRDLKWLAAADPAYREFVAQHELPPTSP